MTQIPKKIYYCWFGGNKKNELQKACINSWYNKCPDYEIIEINEKNFDVNFNEYCKQAYEHKNYAFVADMVRLEILRQNGGFYLDTDIKLLKSLDELRKYDAVIPSTGKGYYNVAPFACAKFIDLFQDIYDRLTVGNCILQILNQLIYERYDILGLDFQLFDNIAFLGAEYFVTHDYKVTDKTIGIHYCLGSWLDQWKGGYDKSKTFNSFEMYQDGVRDISYEKRYFNDNEKVGKIYTFNSPANGNLKFYGNYFFNPRVMAIEGDNFYIERYNPSPIKEIYETEGLIIKCS